MQKKLFSNLQSLFTFLLCTAADYLLRKPVDSIAYPTENTVSVQSTSVNKDYKLEKKSFHINLTVDINHLVIMGVEIYGAEGVEG